MRLQPSLRISSTELGSAHKIGHLAAALIEDGDTVLTHCNAGSLATAGYGTALAVVRSAVEQGQESVCDRDGDAAVVGRGPRLTAFELARDRIPVKVICDSAAHN